MTKSSLKFIFLIVVFFFTSCKSEKKSKGKPIEKISIKTPSQKAKSAEKSIKPSTRKAAQLSKGDPNDSLGRVLAILNRDHWSHMKIGDKLTNWEIDEIEESINKKLPESYKRFLKEFGDGSYWSYSIEQGIDSAKDIESFAKRRSSIKLETLESDGFGSFKTESLLCLMCWNSNQGAWLWLSSENNDTGEWPIAYYSPHDERLHYKIPNFTRWLELLSSYKGELIRELDTEGKLRLKYD